MSDNTVNVELQIIGVLRVESGETLVEALVRLTKLHFKGVEWQTRLFFALCVLARVTEPELDSFFGYADGSSYIAVFLAMRQIGSSGGTKHVYHCRVGRPLCPCWL